MSTPADEQATEAATLYARKHSGLSNPKDPRFGRYFRAYEAGYRDCRTQMQSVLENAKRDRENLARAAQDNLKLWQIVREERDQALVALEKADQKIAALQPMIIASAERQLTLIEERDQALVALEKAERERDKLKVLERLQEAWMAPGMRTCTDAFIVADMHYGKQLDQALTRLDERNTK